MNPLDLITTSPPKETTFTAHTQKKRDPGNNIPGPASIQACYSVAVHEPTTTAYCRQSGTQLHSSQ